MGLLRLLSCQVWFGSMIFGLNLTNLPNSPVHRKMIGLNKEDEGKLKGELVEWAVVKSVVYAVFAPFTILCIGYDFYRKDQKNFMSHFIPGSKYFESPVLKNISTTIGTCGWSRKL